MAKSNLWPPLRLPLRARLTLWYLLTLAVILVIILVFVYWQVQRSLLAQVDAALHVAATQALVSIRVEEGQLAFQNMEDNNVLARRLGDAHAVYLLAPDGTIWDWLGRRDEFPVHAPYAGMETVTYQDDQWRVYAERISSIEGGPQGWLQVAQELDAVTETLAGLRRQMLLGLPVALLLAGFGGYFLAWRALRPIDRITRTAQTINGGDLSRRLEHSGPADEVGRLAATFDSMLDRLQAAFERERRFTGDAAHELRTPLTALKGRLEVSLSRPRPVGAYRETLEEMEEQVDRLIRLSNDLLFIARLDQGQQTLQWERIELNDLVAVVVDQVAPLAKTKNVGVSRDLAPDLTIHGDLDLLIRLFLNLLDNAVKYTPVASQVTITGTATDDGVSVAVSDTGPGIPADNLPHLFERFYRVEDDRGRRTAENERGGAGLGLAIAQEIVRAHGGSIDVESRVGRGTAFTVHFPGQSRHEVGARASSNSAEPMSGDGHFNITSESAE